MAAHNTWGQWERSQEPWGTHQLPWGSSDVGLHQHWVSAGPVQQLAEWRQGEVKPQLGAALTPENKEYNMPSD